MIGDLDHIGVAVSNLSDSIRQYQIIGFKHHETEEVKSEKVRVAILYSNITRLELLEPLSEDSPISQFLKKRGGGVHHLAYKVKNIENEVMRLKKEGVAVIDPAPRPGAQGSKVAFLHPKSTGGVLIELVERPQK